MAFLKVRDATLFYETWGEDASAPWVTLVNGHTRTTADFRHFGRYLAEKGWRVLSFDNRGAGKTECEPDFTMDDIVGDVRALWRELGASRSHVMGISFGGAITLALAGKSLTDLGALVLVSTASRFDFMQGGERPEMAKYFSPDFPKKNPLLFRAMTKDTGHAYEDARQASGTLAQKLVLRGFNADAWLGSISRPTLVVHGAEDAIVPPVAAHHLAEKIPGARLELIPAVGHLLLAECPKRLYEIVESFFASGEL